MEDLKKVYIEEAGDLILRMEQSLLELEKTPNESSLIADIFRSMHTLKGNSGMFGLQVVADFVHNLETLYDKVRTNEMKLSKEVVDCTFSTIDHLKRLIYDSELAKAENKKNHTDLTARILKILELEAGTETEEVVSDYTEPVSQNSTFHIYFNPDKNAFDDGTNPLFLIDELASLGKTKVFVHIKPAKSIDDFDPEKCYTFWDVLLVTNQGENSIRDIFLFVEDTAEIEINLVHQGDLLSYKEYDSNIPAENLSTNRVSLDSLKSLAEDINLSEIPTEKSENMTSENITQNEPAVEKEAEDNSNENDGKITSSSERAVSSIRVPADKLDELMNQVSELITTQAGLSLYAQNNQSPELEAISENVEKLSRQLRDIAFEMTLVPIKNLFGRYQRAVRDITSKLGKSVNFITEGGETELDKSIIESLTDPLLHLIRNSLDHGIESKEERLRKGKSQIGQLTLKSYYSGAKVYIQIEDDGRGIDVNIIRNKAIELGLISKEDILTESETYNLLFAPGFSTAKNVTDVSGRGVGMDVVMRNIMEIRGDVTVESTIDVGTKITLVLPLTLSIIDGLLVKIQNSFFVIPLAVVSKCYEVTKDQLGNEFNKLVVLDDEQIPFMNLHNEFNLQGELPEFIQLIVVENEERKVGLTVDSIVGEYQAVLKPLGKYYRNQDFISGATILGDGNIALVMDTNRIINQFSNLNKEEIA